jgi:hypothetical protein
MRLVACLTAIALATAGPAFAASKSKVRKVIEAAGLMGWSAQDCSKPAGADNAWERFEVGEEGYVTDSDFEGTDGSSFYVVDARKLKTGEIWMRLEVNLGEPDLTVTYRIEGQRHMTWTARTAEGTLVIDQGKWVNSDEAGESAWYTRCPGPPPGWPAP